MNYGRDVVEATLASLGVSVSRVNKKGWGVALCPLHDDNSPSFVVHMEEGGWRCRAGCGSSGDLAELVEAVTGQAVVDARRELLRGAAPSVELLEAILDGPEESEDEVQEPLFYDRSQVPQYIVDRGFNMETLKAWQVGWDENDRSVVIPARDERSNLVGLIRRRVDDWKKPKYLNTEGEWRGNILFGLDMAFEGAPLYVVEGPLDAMWLWQHGRSGVALLGSSLSERQADLIRRRAVGRTYTGFDNDKAGRAATAQVASALAGLDVWALAVPEGRDIQQLTGEEIADLVESANPVWV